MNDLPLDYVFQACNEKKTRLRRHQHMLPIQRAILDMRHLSFSPTIVSTLNRLSKAVMEAESVNTFKIGSTYILNRLDLVLIDVYSHLLKVLL